MWSIPITHLTTVSHFGCITVVTKPHKSHSRRRSTLQLATFSCDIFRQPPFQPTSIPAGASLSDLHSDGSLVGKHLSMRRHALIFSPMLKFTRRCMRHYLATRLLQQCRLLPTSLSNHSTRFAVVGKSPHFPFFLSGDCFRAIILPESPFFLCVF